MLRFTHFCALAFIVSRYLSRDWNGLKSIWLRPLVLCGQHSLPLFCLGVFLSFGAHWVLVQYSNSGIEQIIVALAGILDHDRCRVAPRSSQQGAKSVRRCRARRAEPDRRNRSWRPCPSLELSQARA